MYKTYLVVFSFLLFITFESCISSKKLNYFDDQIPGVQKLDSTKLFNIQRIKQNDRLTIVISSTDPALTAYLNPNVSSVNNIGGYLVDSKGAIEFPLLGKVAIEGLTSVEAATLLKEKLAYFYKDLYVNVSLQGKVFFLTGRGGGNFPLQNERMTILEAVAQMPNNDPYDRRDDVWLIREDSGQRYFSKVNLNSKKIFESPYYYLKNNDVIYIKPGKFSNTWFNTASSPVRGVITIFGSILAMFLVLRNL